MVPQPTPDRRPLPAWLRAAGAFIAALCLLALAQAAVAAPQPVLSLDEQGAPPTDGHLRYLIDTTHQQTIDDIDRLPPAAWQVLPRTGHNFGYVSGTLWLRLVLRWTPPDHSPPRTQAPPPHTFYLRAGRAVIDDITLYRPDLPVHAGRQVGGGPWIASTQGDLAGYAERPLPLPGAVFTLPLPPGDTVVYLRVRSESALQLPLQLDTTSSLAARQGYEQWLVGLAYGAMLMLSLYHLLLYRALREKLYLMYAAFGLAATSYLLCYHGYLGMLLPTLPRLLTDRLVIITSLLGILAAINLVRGFLPLRTQLPRIDALLRGGMLLALLLLLLSLSMPYRPLAQAMTLLHAALGAVCILAAFILWRRGLRAARLLLAAWLLVYASSVIRTLQIFGLMPDSFGNVINYIAILLFLALVALALSERIRDLRLEHEQALLKVMDMQQAANHRLETEIEQRTVALRDALAQAKQAAHARDDFLSVMSHEMRTPLTAILGGLHLLETQAAAGHHPPHKRGASAGNDNDNADGEVSGDGDSGNHHTLLQHMRSSGELLLALINDVLDMAQLESGAIQLVSEPLSPRHLAQQIVSLLRVGAEQKGLHLQLESDDIPTVLGDARRLRQILLNLVGNAIKFTQHGGIDITLRHECEASGGRIVFTLAVTDTGVGIAAHEQARIFDKFWQGDAHAERQHGGSGLGLAIARRLAQAMGSELELDSQPGWGSCFWLTLSLPRAPQADNAPAAPRHDAASPGLCMLLVEDVRPSADVLSAQLRRLGHHVIVAHDGYEAIAKVVEGNAIDVILMDLRLPGMNGFETADCLRSLDAPLAAIPILALTANVREVSREKCLAHGMRDVLSKPLDIARLRAALARLFPEWAATAPPATPIATTAAGAPRRFEHLIDDYVALADGVHAHVHRCLDHHDFDGAAEHLHRLAGASLSLGLLEFGDYARVLEKHARAGSAAALRQALQDFDIHYGTALAQLHRPATAAAAAPSA